MKNWIVWALVIYVAFWLWKRRKGVRQSLPVNSDGTTVLEGQWRL